MYEHYFEQRLDRETHALFLDRLHTQVQALLKDRGQEKRKSPHPPQDKREEPFKEQQAAQERGGTMEPDVSFIYSLAGEA